MRKTENRREVTTAKENEEKERANRDGVAKRGWREARVTGAAYGERV